MKLVVVLKVMKDDQQHLQSLQVVVCLEALVCKEAAEGAHLYIVLEVLFCSWASLKHEVEVKGSESCDALVNHAKRVEETQNGR